jgi:DNA-binding MarR family transcriptional regulator
MKHEGARMPIGIALWETTQLVMRAFDKVLAEHGGNRPIWFVYLALDQGEHTTQRELAREIGISEATLTHHLNALETRGLVARRRDERDRRVQRIEFTTEGRAAFEGMKAAAFAYERGIRESLGPARIAELQTGLDALAAAVREPGDDRVRPPVDPTI